MSEKKEILESLDKQMRSNDEYIILSPPQADLVMKILKQSPSENLPTDIMTKSQFLDLWGSLFPADAKDTDEIYEKGKRTINYLYNSLQHSKQQRYEDYKAGFYRNDDKTDDATDKWIKECFAEYLRKEKP
jgi:hypothetical protein